MRLINKYLLNILNKSNKCFVSYCTNRFLSSSSVLKKGDCSENNSDNSSPKKGGIFKVFQDEESSVILDVEEERCSLSRSKLIEPWDEFYGINLERGVNGVYEIEDLIDVVRKNRAQNIFVVQVPEVINYVDYLVIVSCTSKRHIYALTQFVMKVYKKKRHKNDIIPPVVGEGTSDWVALDLGNIALHVMTDDMRDKYDLETLWSVGPKFDDLSMKSHDSTLEILQKHSINLDDFTPAKQIC